MSLFETEDEWEEDWFERSVDELQEKAEKDSELREKLGFSNKTDAEWKLEKERLKAEAEEEYDKFFTNKKYESKLTSCEKVIVVKKKKSGI